MMKAHTIPYHPAPSHSKYGSPVVQQAHGVYANPLLVTEELVSIITYMWLGINTATVSGTHWESGNVSD